MVTPRPDWAFGRDTAEKLLLEHFRVQSLDGFGCGGLGLSLSAAGATLQYLQETQKISLRPHPPPRAAQAPPTAWCSTARRRSAWS